MMLKYPITQQQRLWIGGCVVIVIIVSAWWLIFAPTSALDTPQPIHISSGDGLTVIATALAEKGFIRSATIFKYYVFALGWEKYLKAGDYIIPAGSNLNDIAYQISDGHGVSTDISVIIPEGSNIWEIDKRLTDAGLVTEGQFASAYGSHEGFLFPDTYRFEPESLLGEIEQIMELNGQDKTRELIGGLSLTAKEKIITIASIIEKEARTQSDMRLVSGVIANRLKRGMVLAIDATVSYGACLREFKGSAPKGGKDCQVNLIAVGEEVNIDSAYNTYTRAGLPPGPISNPGLTAIEAALNPKGDYLYYLSTRDGSQIIFAHTGAEHAANRRKYLGL